MVSLEAFKLSGIRKNRGSGESKAREMANHAVQTRKRLNLRQLWNGPL